MAYILYGERENDKFQMQPAVIFGRGYMPDKLVKHAATVYNIGN